MKRTKRAKKSDRETMSRGAANLPLLNAMAGLRKKLFVLITKIHDMPKPQKLKPAPGRMRLQVIVTRGMRIPGMPDAITGSLSDTLPISSLSYIADARTALNAAHLTLLQGEVDTSWQIFARASEFYGMALAFHNAIHVNSELARVKARARHRPTDALKKTVIDYWTKNIDKKLSAAAATQILMRKVIWEMEDEISYETLRAWISAEKKTLKENPNPPDHAVPPASPIKKRSC